MRLRDKAKVTLGRLLPVDWLERLTEYSILESMPNVALTDSKLVYAQADGSPWPEVHQGRVQLWRKMLDKIGAEDILFLEFGVAWGNRSANSWV